MKRLIALYAVLAALVTGSAALSTLAAPRAQTSVDVQQDATVLGTVRGGPAAASSLTAATVAMAPGQATLPLVNQGSILIVVRSGTVSVLSDRPPGGAGPRSRTPAGDVAATAGDGTGGAFGIATTVPERQPAKSYTLPAGSGFTIAPGTFVQIRAVTQAEMLIVSLVPQ